MTKLTNKHIREAKAIYGWVNTSDDDGQYLRLYKNDLLYLVGQGHEITTWRYGSNQSDIMIN